jgi:hypothetical protein
MGIHTMSEQDDHKNSAGVISVRGNVLARAARVSTAAKRWLRAVDQLDYLVRNWLTPVPLGEKDLVDTNKAVQLATAAVRHAVPVTSATCEIAEAGGLMSYGPNIADAWREVGVYAGRLLKELCGGGP